MEEHALSEDEILDGWEMAGACGREPSLPEG